MQACDIGGPGDRGIDAYFHDEDQGQIIIAQAKYAGRAKTFDREAVLDLLGARATLRQLAQQESPRAREQVIEAAWEIADLRGRDPAYPVALYCFAAGPFSPQAVEAAEAFNAERADENVAIELVSMERLADAMEQNDSRLGDVPVGVLNLPLKAHFPFTPAEGEPETVVAAVDGAELAKIEREFKYRIFQRNVRFFLSGRGRENKGMARTLQSPDQRKRFWFYNNGISMVCDEVKVIEAAKGPVARITNLQIVNGCQTTTTLGENINTLGDESSRAHVLVRIIAADDDELQQLISLYNNRQNNVTRRAFGEFAFERPGTPMRAMLLSRIFQGVGFSEQEIAQLAELTGENGRGYGFTYSDITTRLASTVLLGAFDDKAVAFEDVVATLGRVTPTPPFLQEAS